MQMISVSTITADTVVSDAKEFFYQCCLDAVESGIIVRRWWEARGKEQALFVGFLALLFVAAMAAGLVTLGAYLWRKAPEVAARVETALTLTNDWGWVTPPVWTVSDEVAVADDAAMDEVLAWSVARWPHLAEKLVVVEG